MNNFQIRIITLAMDDPEDLSDWENEFIDSIADHEEDYELSAKQNKVLNRIGQKLEFG